MPLVQPYNEAVQALAVFGVIAHMNGELDGFTPQLESYFYENYDTLGHGSKAPNAMDLIIGHATIETRMRLAELAVQHPERFPETLAGFMQVLIAESVGASIIPN